MLQKVKHTEVYDEIIQISQKKDMNEAIDIHSQEVEETIGRETVTSVKSKNAKLWDWAKKVFGDTGRYFLEVFYAPALSKVGGGYLLLLLVLLLYVPSQQVWFLRDGQFT